MESSILLGKLRRKVNQDCKNLEELTRLVENFFHLECGHREELVAKELEGVTDEFDAAFIAACHAEDVFQVQSDFPRVQRYALFVSMMSMLEANVVGLCRAAHNIFEIQTEFNARGSGVVSRGVEYLKTEVNINTSRFPSYIKLAQNLNFLRNCITHAEGSLEGRDDAQAIEAFINTNPTLELDQQNRLILLKGFVENSTHTMHTYVNRLHDAVKERSDTQQDL